MVSKKTKTNNTNNYQKLIANFVNEQWKATVENNIVKCIPPHTETYAIGTYHKTGDKTYEVYNNSNYIIGKISDTGNSALMHLSRLGMLKKFKDMGFPKPTPNELVFLCAESFPKTILETNTYNECAYYNGNDYIGAAAAFICMHYEVISNSKFHIFFKL